MNREELQALSCVIDYQVHAEVGDKPSDQVWEALKTLENYRIGRSLEMVDEVKGRAAPAPPVKEVASRANGEPNQPETATTLPSAGNDTSEAERLENWMVCYADQLEKNALTALVWHEASAALKSGRASLIKNVTAAVDELINMDIAAMRSASEMSLLRRVSAVAL